jgi:hypothetical protein
MELEMLQIERRLEKRDDDIKSEFLRVVQSINENIIFIRNEVFSNGKKK